MVEVKRANKNEIANTSVLVKQFYNIFGLPATLLKSSLAEGLKK